MVNTFGGMDYYAYICTIKLIHIDKIIITIN
jgi:hypothetical protein